MRLILFSLFILLLLKVSGQEGLKYDKNSVILESRSGDKLAVSSVPLTNRDYIIYLSWLIHVYNLDYPEVVYDALNFQKGNRAEVLIDIYDLKISSVLSKTSYLTQNYTFNSQYLDYPVLGLTVEQAINLNKWLGDRYNEYQLIKSKSLKYYYTQIDEDNFNTEAYMANQYDGISGIKRNRDTSYWTNTSLQATFRLPDEYEVEGQSSLKLKSYSKERKKWLSIWDKRLLVFKENTLLFNSQGNLSDTLILSTIEFDFSQWNLNEIILGKNNYDIANVEKYRVSYDGNRENWFPKKDSLGYMYFYNYSKTLNGNSLVYRLKPDYSYLVDSLSCFRYAVNMIINDHGNEYVKVNTNKFIFNDSMSVVNANVDSLYNSLSHPSLIYKTGDLNEIRLTAHPKDEDRYYEFWIDIRCKSLVDIQFDLNFDTTLAFKIHDTLLQVFIQDKNNECKFSNDICCSRYFSLIESEGYTLSKIDTLNIDKRGNPEILIHLEKKSNDVNRELSKRLLIWSFDEQKILLDYVYHHEVYMNSGENSNEFLSYRYERDASIASGKLVVKEPNPSIKHRYIGQKYEEVIRGINEKKLKNGIYGLSSTGTWVLSEVD